MGRPVARTYCPVKLLGILSVQGPEVGVRYLPPAANDLKNPFGHPAPERVDCVAVAEPVGMQVGDPGPFPQPLEHQV